MNTLLKALAEELRQDGKIHLSECLIDATFAGAKRVVQTFDLRGSGKGSRSWQWQATMVFYSAGAPIHEGKLVERTLDHRFIRRTPGGFFGDKAFYDGGLDVKLRGR